MKAKNTRNNEEKYFAEFELRILKVLHSFHPIVKREYTPIVLSNVLPMQFKDFVPKPDADTGQVEMHCERNCYFIDKIKAPNSSSYKYWISVYDYSTDQRKPLINVSAESGFQETDQFAVVRLDMRPAGP